MKNRFLCQTLYDLFECRILSGELNPGARLPSNQEIATEFKVSLMTANRTMNQLVQSGYIRREQGRGSFVCDTLPCIGGRKFHIGIADKITYPPVPMINAALDIRPKTASQYLQDCGCSCHAVSYDDVCSGEIADIAKKLDGLIISSGFIDKITEKNLLDLQIPIVVINGEFASKYPFHQVVMDMRPALVMVAQEIIKRNYDEIIIIKESHIYGMTRCRELINELVSRGFDSRKIRCFTTKDFALENALSSYQLGLQLVPELAGKLLFSTSDVVSFSLLEAFNKSGLVPGKDFDLLSFDNLEDYGFCPLKEAKLTSIDCPKVDISKRAAQLLLEKINHPEPGTTIIRLPATLKIRSTAFGSKQ